MNKVFQIWNNMIKWGVKHDTPEYLKRKVIICNQIALTLSMFIMLFAVVTTIVLKQPIKGAFIFIASFLFIGSLVLNLSGKIKLSRYSLVILFPIEIIVVNCLSIFLQEEAPYSFLTFIGPRVFISSAVIIPLVLIDQKKEFGFYVSSLISYFFVVVFFDFIYEFIGVNVDRKDYDGGDLNYINLVFVFNWLGLVAIFIFWNRIVVRFEEHLRLIKVELKEKSDQLIRKRSEIDEQVLSMEKTTTELSRQKRLLDDGVNVAKSIQHALFPSKEEILRVLPNHFLIYKPREIISGDFYLMAQKGIHKIVVVADCTGHGVPGAFMTLMGLSQLERLIEDRKMFDPAAILDVIQYEVHRKLNKNLIAERLFGMDIAILCWEEPELGHPMRVRFASAKRPLYLIRNHQMNIFKGDKKSIDTGFVSSEFSYHTEEIEVYKGDQLYLFSDGFTDQNNDQRKKIGLKKLEQEIMRASNLSFSKQEDIFQKLFDDHKGSQPQRDDVIFLGIKI